MQNRAHGARDIGGLLLLFGLFLAFAVYSERSAQEVTAREIPSSFNAKDSGVKALFLLLESQHFRVDRLRAPWTALRPDQGLMIQIEPFDKARPVREEELRALKRWVERGGTVFYLVAEPPRSYDKDDGVFGDVAIDTGKPKAGTAAPEKVDSPYLRDLHTIAYRSPVRLNPATDSGYETLLQDEDGALLIHKPLGRGHLLLAALGPIASNAAIKEADNAYLFYNIAAETIGHDNRVVAFDEYHHGVGFGESGTGATGGLLQNTPAALRWTFYYLIAFGILLVYNGNRRFGAPRHLEPPPYRPRTDYVGAVGRLFHRAGATDLALTTLHHEFRRDLARRCDLAPDSDLSVLLAHCERRYPAQAPAILVTLQQGEESVYGKSVSEAEMVAQAQRIDTLRRNCNLVG